MNKIIIQNDTNLSDEEALMCILQVIKLGRISNEKKQYCYHAAFENEISVWTYLNKKSDRFVIEKNI